MTQKEVNQTSLATFIAKLVMSGLSYPKNQSELRTPWKKYLTSCDPVFEVKYEVSCQFKVQIWTQRPEIIQDESILPQNVD